MESGQYINFNVIKNQSNLNNLGFSFTKLDTMSGVTVFGLTLLIFYAVTKLLNFYSIGSNMYGSYLLFYVFLLFAIYFTPNYHIIH